MKDFLRTLFGVRTKRRAHPVTPPPRAGESIVRQGFKIPVSHPMRAELWDWLLLSGWRVVPVRHDRRSSISLPDDALRQLELADAADRETLLREMLQRARRRPPPDTARH
ncbi:MAG: hypothetical protein CGU28_15420 [Candidatus Dactylopiibacterium carminicum]|uniref:Uncharacterized protein n=1 Tax=Candidatus Dactylopiibacterium carminicum TaxID=857335 RepID=A0A272EN59_9RHOO|nr:hypothetical protein [Candidatus Dactylopiibacterium carminicum]KAF7597995.1 hypothetical protein BGI27_15700 [Candidatus Dactylopiibacterium carminicum]PAS91568.1 MAG: hypothetical protein CGU29_15745 [Candidatus Dactylopiibacterium carminicum]PAS93229.1 MAG: hypothetical protein CGU28_15420 [Candidatus Dactylopiibacterium carminicum]PAS96245.1 MAG: hypothetical protein BSR46_15735 [Candidatus Dactylopiibacterium carminicum]